MRSTYLALAMGGLLSALAPAAFADGHRKYEGETITVLLPPWGTLPAEMVESFTGETGINVDMQTLGWDDLRTRIVTSLIANQAPGDVIEFDWSWVGQFGAAGWFANLDDLIDPAVVADMIPAPIFTYGGNLIGVPYSNDFRMMILNKNHFEQAGVTELATTLDALQMQAKAIKEAGVVAYPLGLALGPYEGTSTNWYTLSKAYGGDLFDNDFNPLFLEPDSAGYKALKFIVDSVEAGLIDPASMGMTDVQIQERFKAGEISVDLAGFVGNLAVYNDPERSKVAGSAVAIRTPGENGPGRGFGLPEAVGIPHNSEQKGAAAAFISFIAQQNSQKEMYAKLGLLPTRTSVIETLNAEGQLSGGDGIIAAMQDVEPLFKQGTPQWYSRFSNAVSTSVNAAAKGQITLDEALKRIADTAADAKLD
jgi:multiple sugar transport system substrate-binding protein